jgi:hypothetical protein
MLASHYRLRYLLAHRENGISTKVLRILSTGFETSTVHTVATYSYLSVRYQPTKAVSKAGGSSASPTMLICLLTHTNRAADLGQLPYSIGVSTLQ